MIPICCVDAFTDKPFSGNPAAVCLLEKETPDEWKQSVAAEMNLSETAFVMLAGSEAFGLRWFTPTVEVDLCGHATLAAAHVLWERGIVTSATTIFFDTRSGRLAALRGDDGISMDFPSVEPAPASPPPELVEGLGVSPARVRRAGPDYLVELLSADDVLRLDPDFSFLRRVNARGIIVTARGDDPETDFVSRFFAPAAGIDEDPVTGSSHCALGPHWGPRLGKTVLRARQLSKRGGSMRVELKGDRVILTGQAVTVWTGELEV